MKSIFLSKDIEIKIKPRQTCIIIITTCSTINNQSIATTQSKEPHESNKLLLTISRIPQFILKYVKHGKTIRNYINKLAKARTNIPQLIGRK